MLIKSVFVKQLKTGLLEDIEKTENVTMISSTTSLEREELAIESGLKLIKLIIHTMKLP